jgi:hypothetical protein
VENDMGPIPSRRTIAGALALPALLASLLPLAAGQVQAHPLYDTTRVLEQEGIACVGRQDCKVIASEPRRIKVGRADDVTARCPDARPYLVNWDARRHEHISVTQLKRWPGGVTVVAINNADAPGRVTLFIGCAKERHRPTVELQSPAALPSKALKVNRR